MLSAQKASLRIVGLAGLLIFATFFAFTFAIPDWIERFAAGFIEAEVSAQIDARIDNFEPREGESALSRMAAALYRENQEAIDRLKAALKSEVHIRMAEVIAEISDLDCECRDKYAQVFREGFEFDIALLQAANDRVVDFIQRTYMEIVAELKRDIRVFTGSNAGAFLLLLLASFVRPKAIRHLFLPATLALISTAICSYFYIFEQNWLLTIIYSDYLGFAYLAYLGLVFLFLLDIFFNRGRVIAAIVNAVSEAVGSTLSLGPC